ncbi:long-chain-fatty-acid--CoA ligase domain protein, partial [Vibrio parahaemolyticus V-223/04]
LEGKPL